MSQDVTLVNTFYPSVYFGDSQTTVISSTDFWASIEQLPPATESLLYDFGQSRPLNFIDFEISLKPVDILIETSNDQITWTAVTPVDDFPLQLSVQYLPSQTNPWGYTEYHFSLVQVQYVRLTFTRRTDPFPLPDSDPFPWSIEVRNARFLNIIQQIEDFIPDVGIDILNNSYRTDVLTFPATNVVDGDETSFWQSQPNPSPFAVEALYFDLRENSVPGTMGTLDLTIDSDLDTRSMADMESYLSDGIVVDEVFIDPVTFGPSMHIYYSLDTTPEWDNKLWIPINRNYVLKKGYHALPSPTFAKFLKLEFSNLVAAPYNTQESPMLPPIFYNQFPTWVQNYFQNIFTSGTQSQPFINPIDRVSVDPLQLGFLTPDDAFDSSIATRNAPTIADTDLEIMNFLDGTPTTAQVPIENQIEFNSPFMFQQDLTQQLDKTKALSRFVLVGASGWNAEQPPVTEPLPTVQSVPDLSAALVEKTTPIMYFPYKCRHAYQVVKADRPSKVAFFVAIREVGFYRRDYTATFDEPYYIETFDDTTHFGPINDFVQDDWRYVITP